MTEESEEFTERRFLSYPINSGIIDIQEEKKVKCVNALKTIANKHNAVLLTLIAPYIGKKVSPVDVARAKISIEEELGIETALEIMRTKLGELSEYNLFLLLETLGGNVDSSYKIAKLLVTTFKSVTIFIIHEAASGGTLISFAGSRIVMGETANLSPIDVQTNYQGVRVSVNMATSSLTSIAKFFKTKQVEQVEYPYTALANKLDPIIYEDWSAKQWAMVRYAHDILSFSGYSDDEKIEIVRNFVFTKFPHNYVILKERASKYGLNIAKSNVFTQELNCMRWWLNNYMFQKGAFHIIRFVMPEKKKGKQMNASVDKL